MSQNVSVRDKPVNISNEDKLGTAKYAESLGAFIRDCEAPLTIGIQGEWGSGKTSLLNLIVEELRNQQIPQKRNKTVSGEDYYKLIWINTWEHALLKSPEECLLSIVEEIISEVSKVDGSYNTAARAKAALANLARGAVKVGTSAALAATVGYKNGSELADEFLGGGDENSVKALRNSLNEIVEKISIREENPVKRFVVFVDDLDRLHPATAVQILELLKNIFDVDHCVFVLAIDYQVVVKGLKTKFGEQTEENEWEFRAFFDKIIQLPFMMPMSTYTLDSYINHMMTDGIGWFTEAAEKKLIQGGILQKIVKLTLGNNPRALKRLTNALSLIRLSNTETLENNKNSYRTELKQLTFALICLQISFPKIYELLLINHNFPMWDDEFANKVTGGPHNEDLELRTALEKAVEVHEEDFDEDWERALFKIVWLKKWQRSRLVEASRLLSILKDDIAASIPEEKFEEAFEDLVKSALEMTSVTAVISGVENLPVNDKDDSESASVKNRISYWRNFVQVMKGTGTVFDSPISSNHHSHYVAKRHDDMMGDTIQFVVSSGSSSPLKIESYSGKVDRNFAFFQYLKAHKQEFEKAARTKVKFEGSADSNKQQLIFLPPDGIKRRVKLDDPKNAAVARQIHDWIAASMTQIEEVMKKAIDSEDDIVESVSGSSTFSDD